MANFDELCSPTINGFSETSSPSPDYIESATFSIEKYMKGKQSKLTIEEMKSLLPKDSVAALDFQYEYPQERVENMDCLLYTSPSPRDKRQSRMPSSA